MLGSQSRLLTSEWCPSGSLLFLYLRCEDAILAIMCTGPPFTTTIAGELTSLAFHDDIKYVTANGQTDDY